MRAAPKPERFNPRRPHRPANAALLCPRHHTHVHERDLTATATSTGVTWHTHHTR